MKTLSASLERGTKTLRYVTLFAVASLLIGLLFVLPMAMIAQEKKSAEEHKLQQVWHDEMVKIPHPKKTGTFEAAYPKKEWREVKYNIVPRPHPLLPRKSGPTPLTIGNGNNLCAKAPTGLISSATGSFDSVSAGISVTGQVGGAGPQVANAYSLQLNTNFFPSTVAGSPAGCLGWEQFVFTNDGGTSTNNLAFIQYWLIGYGTTSPGAGWINYPAGGSDWYRNSANISVVPNQAISNLANLRLSGTVSAASDSYFLSTGATIYSAAGDNAVKAAAGWNVADFCVVGDGYGKQANFNTGAKIVTRTQIVYGGTDKPNCMVNGFTAETNNLSFDPIPPAASPPGPAVLSEESTAGGATASCASGTTVGDTHLTTFRGLLYDFQASGDFTLAHTGPEFDVQARQVSGAPSWPNASLNHAIATQMGKTKVVIAVGPRLVVDGKVTDLGEKPFYTADHVTIWRKGNIFYVISQSGNSVRATVNDKYIDVLVGLDQCCAKDKVKGLLANAKGNVNQLASRDGIVLTNPFTFKELYSTYGDSWRVPPKDSLFSVLDERVVVANPQKTFDVSDLEPKIRERSRAAAKEAGVKEGVLLDAATLDVAFFNTEKAARVFVDAHPPVAIGKIVGYK
jgi:von Willebrand factor type D domain